MEKRVHQLISYLSGLNFCIFCGSSKMKSSNKLYRVKCIKCLYWLPAIYSKNTEIPMILYVPFYLKIFGYTFFEVLYTCEQRFMISTKLHKLRTLDKWVKEQYLTKCLCSKPQNKFIKSKPSCKTGHIFLTCLGRACA